MLAVDEAGDKPLFQALFMGALQICGTDFDSLLVYKEQWPIKAASADSVLCGSVPERSECAYLYFTGVSPDAEIVYAPVRMFKFATDSLPSADDSRWVNCGSVSDVAAGVTACASILNAFFDANSHALTLNVSSLSSYGVIFTQGSPSPSPSLGPSPSPGPSVSPLAGGEVLKLECPFGTTADAADFFVFNYDATGTGVCGGFTLVVTRDGTPVTPPAQKSCVAGKTAYSLDTRQPGVYAVTVAGTSESCTIRAEHKQPTQAPDTDVFVVLLAGLAAVFFIRRKN